MTDENIGCSGVSSLQLYIARDLLPDYVAVNKRVPLRALGIAADECGSVRARLISFYGAETEA